MGSLLFYIVPSTDKRPESLKSLSTEYQDTQVLYEVLDLRGAFGSRRRQRRHTHLDGPHYPTDIITPGRVSASLFPISNLNEYHPHPLKAHRHTHPPGPGEMVAHCVDSVEHFRTTETKAFCIIREYNSNISSDWFLNNYYSCRGFINSNHHVTHCCNHLYLSHSKALQCPDHEVLWTLLWFEYELLKH